MMMFVEYQEKIANGTNDVYKTAEAVKPFGGKITWEPGPSPGINTEITACLDPDGWKTCLMIDEADRILQVNFEEETKQIMKYPPKDC
ncbi:probable lactoylglutathione lyase, chloroplastic isoform X2 [Durio zibethinus]|uniref:Probable lactoylglutathione lyase, chloroplastic isoform X2 n=1 Tax=Durio zibethinus TaxID=66656 RepID=A0A6P5Y445_DURZI|nr:probable lactoylglutathione lyase, chloroplastic isoform X2 [Durio zibethinus]